MDRPETIDGDPLTLHSSSVAVGGRGLLILGRSGSGKSSLALRLMALGADLVSDDQTTVTREEEGRLLLSAPSAIQGMIEARGLGLLGADSRRPVPLYAVVDLDRMETERLPPFRTTEVLGLPVPLLHNSEWDAFPAALVQYLKGGRKE
ncbi:HPr kinase/phosphorylase [Thalassococcus lentus]|uniref:HPr kinase/phosphatase C-terminal domain-containing protein n=1 Tax=Thalassococcus lentus TaxID=1210524 RepID=A0ABT4XP75_9RHOB|nr:HPr kinase/phosphatase C-terminal domain-containing protein [Thalassococcus lentus]MDA7423736.1 HPr kinase/phosphatase C-terminal domain-containing protein [Thalassococcus lentus]